MSDNRKEQAAFPNEHDWGMTLRDYFAGQALIGLITHYGAGDGHKDGAAAAYNLADHMLKEREK